jgi:hypothetical protein
VKPRRGIVSASTPYKRCYETIRKGVDKVTQALCRLRTRYPHREAIHKAVAYFREHRHRLPYARLRAQNLPIGSGVVSNYAKLILYFSPKSIMMPSTY